MLESSANHLAVLHGQVLVVEQHVHGQREVARSPFVDGSQHPHRFGQHQMRHPRPRCHERLDSRDPRGRITGQQPHEHVGVNGAHVAS